LFSTLGKNELDYLAGTAADLRLATGEYAVHEGEAQALFAIFEGMLEVTKTINGLERVISTRGPGELFGEVPMVLDTPFPAGLRAKESARVVRIEPKEFHTLAAMAPHVSKVVGAAAQERLRALLDIAAQPPPPDATVIGPRSDDASHKLRDFLHRNQVPYDWLTPEEPGIKTLPVKQEMLQGRFPIVLLHDGTIMVDPPLRDLAKAVGLSVKAAHDTYDVVIVGGGPAGLAAAVYSASEGLRTVLLERHAPGGQAGLSARIENYLGFPTGVSGDELAIRALKQAKRFGAEIVVTRSVEVIDANSRVVTLDGGEKLRTLTMILAMGVTWRRLNVESADRLTGRGIYYGASRAEAILTHGKDVYLVGAGNSAGQAALYFAAHAKSVTILCRSDSLAKTMSYYLIQELKTKPNVSVELNSEVVAVYGDEQLEAIDVLCHTSGKVSRRETDSLFTFIGADADTKWLPQEIRRDNRGYVLTGADVVKIGDGSSQRDLYLLETAVRGIFAAGDVRAGSVKRVAAGVGEGSMSIAFVHQYLEQYAITNKQAANR